MPAGYKAPRLPDVDVVVPARLTVEDAMEKMRRVAELLNCPFYEGDAKTFLDTLVTT